MRATNLVSIELARACALTRCYHPLLVHTLLHICMSTTAMRTSTSTTTKSSTPCLHTHRGIHPATTTTTTTTTITTTTTTTTSTTTTTTTTTTPPLDNYEYHVQFFGTKVTRAWLSQTRMMRWAGPESEPTEVCLPAIVASLCCAVLCCRHYWAST
jgi:hypothetical protein